MAQTQFTNAINKQLFDVIFVKSICIKPISQEKKPLVVC